MSDFKDVVKGYTGKNPFSDNQGRNFSDKKIQREFYPTSKFWSLFNAHHEILIGTRGSGKTFMLKMMRRSMLKNIDDPLADRILNDTEYFPLYIPMHMETVASLLDGLILEEKKIKLFKFIFNSLLAESLVDELYAYVKDKFKDDGEELVNYKLANEIKGVWFPNTDVTVVDLKDLSVQIRKVSCSFDYVEGDIQCLPVVFLREFAAPLIAVQPLLEKYLSLTNDTTWILCVDEAEFIPEVFQRSINGFMRSNTNRIALKVATLPYYWRTLETTDRSIFISSENDFSYQVLDMDYNDEDFKRLTNKLCAHRIRNAFGKEVGVEQLEDFLGVVGSDHQIDYYRACMPPEKASKDQIINDIIESFSDERRKGSAEYVDPEKTIFQKFAPTLYVREIYKEMHTQGKGRYNPGWYAGADVVRKVSQGNPRLFIRLMCNLFSQATKKELTLKDQQTVILRFAEEFCKASKAIEVDGHIIDKKLEYTANYIKSKVHGESLISVGNTFRYTGLTDAEFEEWKKWIERAIAFSRISVSEEAITQGIDKNTELVLSNAYAVCYWIPMRKDDVVKVPSNKNNSKEIEGQLSLLDLC